MILLKPFEFEYGAIEIIVKGSEAPGRDLCYDMPKVVVVYLSTSGNTKAMADAIVEGAKLKKIDKMKSHKIL
jgi:hypothetical protein